MGTAAAAVENGMKEALCCYSNLFRQDQKASLQGLF